MPKLLLLSAATFLAGMLTGAIVMSRSEPEPGPAAVSVAPASADLTPDPPALASMLASVPQATPEAAPPSTARSEPEPGPTAVTVQGRLDDLATGWGRMEAELAQLRARVGDLEQRLLAAAHAQGEPETGPQRPETAQQRRDALVEAGVRTELAEELVWRDAQATLARLDLHDLASREGWFGTDRYREEVAKLDASRVVFRDEVGEDAYDRYLYLSGDDNRIRVDSVIAGSAGEDSGLLPGDIIETYGGEKVLRFSDLRSATSAGERGELVPMVVRRGGEIVDLWLPRGPIGIQLDSTRVAPLP